MSEWNTTPQFEDNIRSAFGVPEIRKEFVDQIYGELMRRADTRVQKPRPFFHLRFAGAAALAALFLIMLGILVIGPQRVYAAVARLFGYIPGVGIVDPSRPVRILAEPVSATRDGVTITVTTAVLTADRTHIEYRVFGVPGSAYAITEDTLGCTTSEFLRLADGTQIARKDNDFLPVPAGESEATFVIPCIFNTLPGKAPENWEIGLKFAPAPADYPVMPVMEVSPSPQAAADAAVTVDATAATGANGPTAAAPEDSPVTVDKVIETSDRYILIGQFRPLPPPGEQVQITDMTIQDATGRQAALTAPNDVPVRTENPVSSATEWAIQFNAAGLAYPLTITIHGTNLYAADPTATTQFAFDAGPNPQPGQEWVYGQDLQIAGHTLKLISIRADSRNGYNFTFQGDPHVENVDLQIEGHTAAGWGYGRGLEPGGFSKSLGFTQTPTGLLTVTLSNLIVSGEPREWQSQWAPTVPRADWQASPTPLSGLCLAADGLGQLAPAPTDRSGLALMYQKLDGGGPWGLVLKNLTDGQTLFSHPNQTDGALSPDGSRLVYPAEDGLHIFDLAAQSEKVLAGVFGSGLRWSPDGRQIAYLSKGGGAINTVYIVNIDDPQPRQISDWSYELIIGWSPDSARLYYTAPYTGGAAWKVYVLDIASGGTQELFTIENGTAKALNPDLSPDGRWIAYRGRDNSSLYLVHPDGSGLRLLLDSVNAHMLTWSASGWLGVSLGQRDTGSLSNIQVHPEDCAIYRLPDDLNGYLRGLVIR